MGVLVQTNFGGVLQVAGVEVGKKLGHYSDSFKYSPDGSCMMGTCVEWKGIRGGLCCLVNYSVVFF